MLGRCSSSLVLSYNATNWGGPFCRVGSVETLPRLPHLFSIILRVSPLMTMGLARLQSCKAKPSAVSTMAFSVRQVAEAMRISRILRAGPLPSAASAGIQACAYELTSAPYPHHSSHIRKAQMYSVIIRHAHLAGAAITHLRYPRRVEAGRNLSQARIFRPRYLNALASQTGCPFRLLWLYQKLILRRLPSKTEPLESTLCWRGQQQHM
jgi:hypothetical protein